MHDLSPKLLRSRARDALKAAQHHCDPRRLVLIHVGALLLVNLLSNGLHLFLDSQIQTTAGLGGLGARTVLQTIQTVLSYANLLLTPFWQAGFVLLTIRWATGQAAGPRDLFSGFRRAGSIISYQLFYMLLLFALTYAASRVASVIFAMTPWAAGFLEMVEPAIVDGALDVELLMELPMDALLLSYLPMLGIMALILIPLLIWVGYRFRLASFFIMEPSARFGGVSALFASFRATRGYVGKLFRLDLSWWWYYALEYLLLGVCYLDYILPALGIQLPINETAAYFVFLIAYSLLAFALYSWKQAEVSTTYALAYREIIQPPAQPEV